VSAKAPDLAAGKPRKPWSHIGILYDDLQCLKILSRYVTQVYSVTSIHRPQSRLGVYNPVVNVRSSEGTPQDLPILLSIRAFLRQYSYFGDTEVQMVSPFCDLVSVLLRS
jgi:hypothetical protein